MEPLWLLLLELDALPDERQAGATIDPAGLARPLDNPWDSGSVDLVN